MIKARKLLTLALAVLMVLALSVPAMAAGETEPEETARPEVEAHQMTDGFVLDGSLEEWDTSSPIVINDVSQIVRAGNVWEGPQDLSAEVYVAWDAEYLYLAADMNEDTPFGALEMLPLDAEDNIELYISTDPTADPARTAYGTNDFKVLFILDHEYWDTAIDRSMVDSSLRQRFVSVGMDGGENVLDGYECESQYTTDGYIWEARIPWACFSNERIEQYEPQVGDTVNFNILLTDIAYACPGTEYVPQMIWTGDLAANTDPSVWGRLTFAE